MTKIKQKKINESVEDFVSPLGSLVGAILWFILIIWMLFVSKASIKSMNKKLNDQLTKKFRKIVKDENIFIYECLYDEVNAFCDGTPYLYYFTGLVDKLKLKEDELIAIMLHEYGHLKENHVVVSTSKFVVSTTLGAAAVNLANVPSVLRITLTIIVNTLIGKVLGRAGKYMEVAADSYPGKYGYNDAMISALKKIKKYMYNEMCPGLTTKECDQYMDDLHYWDEHPTPNERIKDLGSKFIKLGLALISMNKKTELVNLITKIKKAWLRVSLKGTSQLADTDILSRL